MYSDVLMLLASLGIILLGCIVFVNAVECFGKALNLHQGIVGSILAAVGTALPETIIPIIAILFTKGDSAHAVGIGAIAGAPFMLATLAFFVTGAAVLVNSGLGRRTPAMEISRSCLTRDLAFFLLFYGAAVSTTFLPDYRPLRVVIALALAASYSIYLRKTVCDDCDEAGSVETLYLTRFFRLPASIFWISLQLAASLGLIIVSAHLFIHYIETLSRDLGASPLILSLIITPIATELPEKFNSVIWIGRRKDTLALGNITGAMVFQSCFPVAFGIAFTEWNLRGATLVSAVCALAMAGVTLAWVKIRKSLNPFVLLLGGAFYAFFLLNIFL